MHIFLLTISHKKAPLEVREKFALSEEDSDRLLKQIQSETDIHECLILNTCNRVEIYICGTNAQIQESLLQIFCKFHNVELSYFKQYCNILKDADAINHLFSVASGLDSQIIGETEILGQVKNAYAVAQKKECLGPTLNRVFQKSFQATKWIRTNTGIGKGQVSTGNVAVELAKRIFGDLIKCRILVIGTGEIGQQTLKALISRGSSAVTIASRTLGKARFMASEYNGVAIDFEHINKTIQHFDIIICATSSTLPVLTHNIISDAMQKRIDEPLFLIDQALPRDIEPTVAEITNAYLYNLDDLANIANENLNSRKAELNKCQEIINEKSLRTWDSLNSGKNEKHLEAQK